MARWRKFCVLMACLPALAAAADPAMWELIMPDARMVMDINLERILASPIGQAMSEQIKTEIKGMRTDWQQPLAGFANLDWSHYAQEVILASTASGDNAPTLVIVRGLLDPAWFESLPAFQATKSSYQGVPILSSGNGNSVVAFLDGSVAVIGKDADVKAAIRRRGQNTQPSAALAEGMRKFEGQYDTWMVSTGGLTPPSKTPAGASIKLFQQMQAFSGGLRFSPDFEISADITMKTEKDVAEMAQGLKWFSGVVQTQAGAAGSLDNMQFQISGKRLSFTLKVPEEQVRAALKQRQVSQTSHHVPAPPVPRAEVTSGLPAPPTGTIRVQSSPSDMGTVLLPLDKKP